MGGGINKFMKQGVNSTGKRRDEDLIQNWKNDKKTRFGDKIAKYVTTRQELLDTDMSKTDFVLGTSYIPITNKCLRPRTKLISLYLGDHYNGSLTE